MHKPSVLVTGASGLIGHELLKYFPHDWTVYAVTRKPLITNLSNIRNLVFDLSTPVGFSDLPNGVDHVVHLAQSNQFREFPNAAMDIFDVNVRSTILLLDYARRIGVKSFVLASSGGIYGSRSSEFHEHEPIQVNQDLGFYLNSRVAAEAMADSFRSYFPMVVLRYFFAYGPRQRHDMLIPRLIRSVKSGQTITLNGRDGIELNPIYVDDAAQATFQALKLSTSEKINIAGLENITLRAMCDMIGEFVDRAPIFEHQHQSPSNSLMGDTKKMQSVLGTPKWSLKDGLAQMFESIR